MEEKGSVVLEKWRFDFLVESSIYVFLSTSINTSSDARNLTENIFPE